MIRRLSHLCFHTDRLPDMMRFYSQVIGLPIKFVFKNEQDELFGCYFDCGDSSFIEIFDRVLKHKKWGGALEALSGGTQYSHFCLEVTGLADLKSMLESRGLAVGPIRTGMDGSLQAWSHDPDGNAIELMEFTSRSAQIQRITHEQPPCVK